MIQADTPSIYTSYIDQSMTYTHYLEINQDLAERIKTGDEEGIVYPQYIPINRQRLRRGNKQAHPSEEIRRVLDKLDQEVHWLVLTEQWCGDAAQSIPLMHKIAAFSDGKLSLGLLNRDEHPDLMDQFLTRGARSIPKLIQLNNAGEVTGSWGPRPAAAQLLVDQLKQKNQPYSEALHSWYARDRYQELNREFAQLLHTAIG